METFSQSAEMYLETLLVLKKRKSVVRAVDIATELGYSKPSVSRALGNLNADGMITVDGSGYIDFTEKGRAYVERLYERHTVLTEILTKVGVSSEVAEEDACRIEHVISDQTFAAIKDYLTKQKNQD